MLAFGCLHLPFFLGALATCSLSVAAILVAGDVTMLGPGETIIGGNSCVRGWAQGNSSPSVTSWFGTSTDSSVMLPNKLKLEIIIRKMNFLAVYLDLQAARVICAAWNNVMPRARLALTSRPLSLLHRHTGGGCRREEEWYQVGVRPMVQAMHKIILILGVVSITLGEISSQVFPGVAYDARTRAYVLDERVAYKAR